MNQFSDENHQAEGGSDPVDKRFNRRSVLKAGIAAGVGIAAGAGATALLLGSEQSEHNQSRRANMSELLDLAMKAHGGLERWRQVQSLDVRVSTTGGLFRLKDYPDGMPNVNLKIDARRPAVTVTPYARPDGRGFFTPDRVWIEDAPAPASLSGTIHALPSPAMSLKPRGTSCTGCTSPAMRCGTTSRPLSSSLSPASNARRSNRTRKTAKRGDACR